MSKYLQNKIISTSVQRSQIPTNIKDYECDLIIEQNIETTKTKKYLMFKHKENRQAPFKIVLSKFKKPATLMHIYKLENQKFNLKGKVERISESRVEKKAKQFSFKNIDSDEEDEYLEKKLTFGNQSSDFDSDDSDSSETGMAPTTQESKSKLLNKRQRISSIKQINHLLKKQYKIKIPESSTKQIVMKICITEKKSKGYTLKPEYIDNDQRIQGRKKVKRDY